MKTPNNQLVFMLIVVATTATFFFIYNYDSNENLKLEEEFEKIIQNNLTQAPILAKAVSVYDITVNKKIFGKNDEVALPIASLAKIMTVIVGLNGHSRDEIVLISPNAVNQAGDFGIFANEKWKINDAAKFTLIVSANDGAYALAEKEENFLEKMNSKGRRIGMENALFLNTTGLDMNVTNVGAFASASDVNTMAIYILKAYPEISRVTTMPEINLKSESGFMHNFKNTDTLIGKIPNLLFSKTGYTEVAGGNLTIIFKDKKEHEIAVTILGSTFFGRFTDMEKIVDVLYDF